MKFSVLFTTCVISTCLGCGVAYAKVTKCKPGSTPTFIKTIGDYDIVAGNVASIAVASSFKGDHLSYSVSSHPKNKLNKVSINAKTGDIRIDAKANDKFDVMVSATNTCGHTDAKFNVIIEGET